MNKESDHEYGEDMYVSFPLIKSSQLVNFIKDNSHKIQIEPRVSHFKVWCSTR